MKKTNLNTCFKIRIPVYKDFRYACQLRGYDEVSH